MGLRGGEDSKRSDGEDEDEAAESVECVAAGFTQPAERRDADGGRQS